MTPNKNIDTGEAIAAGIALGEPKQLVSGRLVGVLVPAGGALTQVDLEKFQPRPARKHGTVTLATAQSFIDWVNRNKTPEAVIYAKESDTSFLAILNGHEANRQAAPGDGEREGSGFQAGAPGWGDFTSRYGCPLSDEWKRWHGKSQHDAEPKKGTPHAEYIQFIEDNLLDITEPASGQMLAAVRSFEVKKDVAFKSAIRLESGDVSFSYSEDTQHAGAPIDGKLVLPSEFELTIPVFKGGTAYVITARLRYRIAQGGLVLWHELVRPHKSLEHAFKAVADQIQTGTSVPMFAT